VTALQILAELCPILEAANIRFWVGGSVASSIWGDPRQTNDIDLAVLRRSLNEHRLRAELPSKFYIGPTEIEEALRDTGEYPSFQILDMDEAFKFDVFVVEEDEYALAESSRVKLTEVLPGQFAPLASPEDIVLHKIRWFVSGGKVSDRQWNDIVKVIEIQLGKLDMTYMARWAAHFEVTDLLSDAFDQAFA
jgi:hypothetical protein